MTKCLNIDCNKEVLPEWDLCPYCGYKPKKCSNPNHVIRWLPQEACYCPECGESLLYVPNHKSHLQDILLFFPICGFTIGQTTVKEVQQHPELFPDVVEIKTRLSNHDNVVVNLQNGADVWAFNNSSVFNDITLYRDATPIFDKWKKLGFDWNLSYDQWYHMFKVWGYKITILREPDIGMNQLNGQYLLAEFEAVSPSQQFKFDLQFAYGTDGFQTHSPRSLYCLSCSCIDI